MQSQQFFLIAILALSLSVQSATLFRRQLDPAGVPEPEEPAGEPKPAEINTQEVPVAEEQSAASTPNVTHTTAVAPKQYNYAGAKNFYPKIKAHSQYLFNLKTKLKEAKGKLDAAKLRLQQAKQALKGYGKRSKKAQKKLKKAKAAVAAAKAKYATIKAALEAAEAQLAALRKELGQYKPAAAKYQGL
jgi:DNA repair exonuclease SbcCD ATPase subunit